MSPEFYNQLGAMHGTIMVFLGVVPLAVGAFGNYLVPLQIGAPDMAFPETQHVELLGVLHRRRRHALQFLHAGRRGAVGLDFVSAAVGHHAAEHSRSSPARRLWLIGMVFLITSSLLGSVNFITTIIQLRATGLTWMRLPFFVWAQFVTAFLLLLAFPPLEAAGVMQLMDRVAGTSFFLPSGLVVGGKA